jgi:hypothetical protein
VVFARKKIGVLTFHRCINYGSYWQARRLVEGLRSFGHEAVLLDHDCPAINKLEWRCALDPALPKYAPRSDLQLYAAKTRIFLKAVEALPLSPRFKLGFPLETEDYDIVIVGSDEVWNFHHPWYGGCPAFFGCGIRTRKLASYAASFGNYSFSEGLQDCWTERLRGFSSISVRDRNSRKLIESSLGAEVAVVLDPCLQFAPSTPPEGKPDRQSYVAVYGHSFPGWFRDGVRKWASKRGCPLVSIGYANDWADKQYLAAGPEEFSQLMACASAVATNFFHGCIFALVNATPFVTASSQYRANKINDLAQVMGAQRHVLNETSTNQDFATALEEPLAQSVFKQIAALRQQSEKYLSYAIS